MGHREVHVLQSVVQALAPPLLSQQRGFATVSISSVLLPEFIAPDLSEDTSTVPTLACFQPQSAHCSCRAEVTCGAAGHRPAGAGPQGWHRPPWKTTPSGSVWQPLSPLVYPWPWAVHTASLLLLTLNHHPQFCLLAVGERKVPLEGRYTGQRQAEAISFWRRRT